MRSFAIDEPSSLVPALYATLGNTIKFYLMAALIWAALFSGLISPSQPPPLQSTWSVCSTLVDIATGHVQVLCLIVKWADIVLDGENEDCKRKFLSKRLEMFSWLVNWGSHKEPGSSISQPCEFNWVSLICSSFNFVVAWISPLYIRNWPMLPKRHQRLKGANPNIWLLSFTKVQFPKNPHTG